MNTYDLHINKHNTIKLIAIIFMTIDHIGALFNITLFRIIGHLSITLFLYSFVTGLNLSRGFNAKKLLMLLLFAAISQPIYEYVFGIKILNIMFLYLLYYIFKLIENKNIYVNIIQAVMFCFLAIALNIEYWYYGFMFMYFYDKLSDKTLQQIVLLLINVSYVVFGYILMKTWIFILIPVSMITIYLVNKKLLIINYHISRYLFYIYYPAHLLILAIIKYIMFNK